MNKSIKFKITFKSGRTKEFTYFYSPSFRDAVNEWFKGNWSVFDNYAFQTSEVESIEEIK